MLTTIKKQSTQSALCTGYTRRSSVIANIISTQIIIGAPILNH
jgi:hypothetical protein